MKRARRHVLPGFGLSLGFTLFYGSLGVLDVYLLTKFAKKGPDGDIGGFIKMKEGRG